MGRVGADLSRADPLLTLSPSGRVAGPSHWATPLQPLARQFAECRAQDPLLQRRRWLPATTLRDKATARVDDGCAVCRRSPHHKVHKRRVLALERAPVQASLGIESEHLVREPHDRTGRSLPKRNDRLRHAHALPRNALAGSASTTVTTVRVAWLFSASVTARSRAQAGSSSGLTTYKMLLNRFIRAPSRLLEPTGCEAPRPH